MKYKIGVFGSAVNESQEAIDLAKDLGYELAQKNAIVITGACTGMPYIVAYEAAQNGAQIWGYASATEKGHLQELYPDDDLTIYKKIFYIPENYRELFFLEPEDDFSVRQAALHKYRNVISTANCDAGILIAGRWGTLNEFTNLFDMGKIIGVLTGTGGVADELESLSKKIFKKSNAILIFETDPKTLVKKVLSELEQKKSDA